MVIQEATILEWPQIEALAQPYYERRHAQFFMDLPGALWWVARLGERVVACYRSHDRVDMGQRCLQDFHRVSGRIGLAGFLALKNHAIEQSEKDGLDLVFWVSSDDAAMRAFVDRYADATLVSLVYLRKGDACGK